MTNFFIVFFCVLLAGTGSALAETTPKAKKVFMIVLENTDFSEASENPYLKQLAQKGATFNEFYAVAHPSQPNYIAMIAGDTHGIDTDAVFTVDTNTIADLLEARGKTWKSYVEDLPSTCYLKSGKAGYYRKHNPFMSIKNIQTNPQRCAQIVTEKDLENDINAGKLPDFSLYIPNIKNDGHDTGLPYAIKWLESTFGPRLKNPKFMKDMLFIITFDESEKDKSNKVFTLLYGDSVKPGTVSNQTYNFYNLLRTIEDYLEIDTLGKKDTSSKLIDDIWKDAPNLK